MSFETASTWRQRLQFNDRLLAQVEEHARDLEDKRRAAEIAFEAARRQLEAVKCEIDDVRAQSDGLRASGDKLRRSLSWRVFQTFPDELLRAIFLDVVRDLWTRYEWLADPGERFYSAPLAKAPFALAAVCSRWRNLALRVPHLWTYISVPAMDGIVRDAYQDFVSLLLARSKPVSLDIVLPWSQNISVAWELGGLTCEAYILEFLAAESHRWRSFELQVAERALTHISMSLFRNLTPALETCAIIGHKDGEILEWAPDFPNFLPLCPNLRRFSSRHTNILPANSGRSCQSLREMNLHIDMPCAAVWDALRQVSPRLETLHLAFERDQLDNSHVIASQIEFPNLRSLTADKHASVMLSTNAALVALPRLQALEISPACITILLPLWQHCPVRINELVIDTGRLLADAAAALLPLTRVKDLTVTYCTLTRAFLDALAEAQADGRWILPNLENVTINSDSEVTEEDGERLIRFVRERKLAHARGGELAPLELRDVVFHWANVPDWAITQVRYIVQGEIPA
ncbi:hypothetical protein AURDEDRAFT_127217 [Auricularia subglabra TFB-10046 SS5]|nr:hypothetical protein AURDEDRAFT_127217 [Auricularia subglabra TFB-10046 SS5]